MDNPDHPNRREALTCMLWAGSGMLWTFVGGVPRSSMLGSAQAEEARATGDFSFVQISDSHIGFANPPNTDPATTLEEATAQVRARHGSAELLIHTGDVSHLSRPAEFDVAEMLVRGTGLDAHYVPGEHDVLVENGRPFFERFTRGAREGGWYSFDQHGVHFIGLNNVSDLRAGGLGRLGETQLEWLEDDLQGRPASQPIVVFAHIPLWTVYRDWGWGTEDSEQALSYLRRFGSVTVLNGHIHQVMQKVEGNVAFHTAMSTAFPQHPPGGPSPGPIRDLPPGRLRSTLGVTSVRAVQGQQRLATVDTPLGA
ncbi:metallophosphoesterase family protein [Falsiroseomonas sp. HW251]|uniref:metallophosphoesterase family protein n=1 Tax=Falsiroseomonas sp. HW251 TaxID=3390998 RepID=UPI003D31D21F